MVASNFSSVLRSVFPFLNEESKTPTPVPPWLAWRELKLRFRVASNTRPTRSWYQYVFVRSWSCSVEYRRHHSSQDVMHWNLITASLLIAVMWNEEAAFPSNFIKPGDTEAIEK